MQFSILVEESTNKLIYKEFSEYIYSRVLTSLDYEIHHNLSKYNLRKSYLYSTSLIKWNSNINTKSINLEYYLTHCIELVNIKGVYSIRVNPHLIINNTRTPVLYLVRLLEYGNNKIPGLPIIRTLFNYYSNNYKYLFSDYMKERVIK